MKKTAALFLYAAAAAVIAVGTAIGVAGCGESPISENGDKVNEFLGFFGSGGGTDNPKTELYKLTVNVDPQGGGNVWLSPEGESFKHGDWVTVTTEALSGYRFDSWKTYPNVPDVNIIVNNDSITSSINFQMPANAVTVTAVFKSVGDTSATKDNFTLTTDVDPQGGGNVWLSPDEESFKHGDWVTVTTVARDGYRFVSWRTEPKVSLVKFDVNLDSTDYSINFQMPANAVTVTAVFESVDGGKGTLNGYDYVTIGGLKWMKKNLDIKTDESWCYGEDGGVWNGTGSDEISSDDIIQNCETYGRLYTWNAANVACGQVVSSVDKWRLPTTDDWNKLVTKVGGKEVAGKALKAKSVNGEDSIGFSAILGGSRGLNGISGLVDLYGFWWTATGNGIDDNKADYRRMGYTDLKDEVTEDNDDKKHGFSVRCVADN